MANTLPAATITDIILNASVLQLQNRHFPLSGFTTDFSDEALARSPNGTGPRSDIKVDLHVSGSTVQTNPTNYESGDNTVTAISIPMAEYSAAFHLTADERNVGRRLEKRVMQNVHELLDTLDGVITGLMTTGNFGAPVLDKDPATVGIADLKTIVQNTGKFRTRNIVTDSTFWSEFNVTNDRDTLTGQGIRGFDRFDYITDWSNAGTNVNGFVGDSTAIAMAGRLPLNDQEVRDLIDMDTMQLPDDGPTIQVARWVNTSSRATWNSLDIVFGAGVGDASAGALIEDGS
jgi:hypothetical protein